MISPSEIIAAKKELEMKTQMFETHWVSFMNRLLPKINEKASSYKYLPSDHGSTTAYETEEGNWAGLLSKKPSIEVYIGDSCIFIYLKKYWYEGDYTILSKIKITDDTTEESILLEFCTFMDNFQLKKEKEQQLKLS